jgi:peroxiredoxin
MIAPLVVGQKVVLGTVYYINDDNVHSSIPVAELFANRRLVVFMGPAPFSRLDTEQAVDYEFRSSEILAERVDGIIGIYVQDAFVTNKFQEHIIRQTSSNNVKLYGDGDGYFARGNNLVHDFTNSGLGQRSGRWVMVLNDGVIEYVMADDYQVIDHTSADSILKYLKNETKVPKTV